MPFDPGLVERVRDALARLGERGSRERRVFSGYGFLQGKQTFVIVWGEGILVKLTPTAYAPALARSGVTPFAPDGERPMGTWVQVHAEVVADDPELAEWVAAGLQGIRDVPPPRARASGKRTTTATPESRHRKPVKQAKRAKQAKQAKQLKPGKQGQAGATRQATTAARRRGSANPGGQPR